MKEIIYPLGAEIDVRAVRLGDATLSVLEIWGAEYQVGWRMCGAGGAGAEGRGLAAATAMLEVCLAVLNPTLAPHATHRRMTAS